MDTGAPSLNHQRRPDADRSADKLDNWYDRGAKAGPAAKRYRKGACENCGALTHKKQDCLERPRKKGAKFSNKDIQADELIQEVSTGYDAKRDRWNGYDTSEHKKVYDEYAAVEAARQKMREDEIDNQTTTDLAAVRKVAKAGKTEGKEGDADFGSSDEEEGDDEKYADAADAVGQKLDTKTRITVRNLRIREDTAKYLINLDPESAYYDPKTRSMRDAPLKNIPAEEVSRSECLICLGYANIFYRRFLLATTSSDILVKHQTCKNFNFSRGKLLHAVTMFISMPTLHRARFYTKNSNKRKRSSRIPRKLVSYPSTAERSTWRKRRRSFCKGKRRTMWNIPGLGRSSRDGNG